MINAQVFETAEQMAAYMKQFAVGHKILDVVGADDKILIIVDRPYDAGKMGIMCNDTGGWAVGEAKLRHGT